MTDRTRQTALPSEAVRNSTRRQVPAKLAALLATSPELSERMRRLRMFARKVRASEYHITNACNIRCKGCWFYEYGFDQVSREETDDSNWRRLIDSERERGVTSALLIGGEPTLFLSRVRLFVDAMPFTTISSNGLRPLPMDGFERVAIALTLFGGGPLDDELRGIQPNGRRFSGLFTRVLANYRDDHRATFVLALARQSIDSLDETVQRIADNGNYVTFGYYSGYGSDDPLGETADNGALLEEALRVQQKYSSAVTCHPYYIGTLLSGRTHWGRFGYESCPSISVKHTDHSARLRNGNPVLPHFNSFAADATSVNFCCTSGHCEGCRDSQAVHSWLLVSVHAFIGSTDTLRTWIEIAEGYWRQFVWSPFHQSASLRGCVSPLETQSASDAL